MKNAKETKIKINKTDPTFRKLSGHYCYSNFLLNTVLNIIFIIMPYLKCFRVDYSYFSGFLSARLVIAWMTSHCPTCVGGECLLALGIWVMHKQSEKHFSRNKCVCSVVVSYYRNGGAIANGHTLHFRSHPVFLTSDVFNPAVSCSPINSSNLQVICTFAVQQSYVAVQQILCSWESYSLLPPLKTGTQK